MFFKHFFIYIQNHLLYFRTKVIKLLIFIIWINYTQRLEYSNRIYKKKLNNYVVQLPNNHKSILFSNKNYKLEEKCLVQITHQKEPNKIKCRDILLLDGEYFTLSTFAIKNKKIDFANNIYSYRAKYPQLFIYPKKFWKQ